MFKPMFIPPAENRTLQRVVTAILPQFAHATANLRGVRVNPEDFEQLRSVGPGRAILSANHPTGDDPIVFFWISRMLGQPFNFLAAREVLVGPKGWLMNRLGTYSVIRGVPDRESLRCTRRLLAELDRKVVIFPEGEIYQHNDRLLAFQSGVPQLGFWALDDLQKAGKQPALPIVTAAFKYRCCDSPRPMIDGSLHHLERALDLETSHSATHYQRLLRIGDRVLAALERDESVAAAEGEEVNARIARVRDRLLERVARTVGATVDPNEPLQDQLHAVFNAVKGWVGLPSDDPSDYDDRLYRNKMATAAPLFRDLNRLQNFIAITGDYIAAEATAERFLEVLARLEKEVFGEIRTKPPREAIVRIAPPLRLEERYDAYRANKRQVVQDLTREMECTIRGMLNELSREATPISLDA